MTKSVKSAIPQTNIG